jgi:hypothetical protein
MGHQLSILAGLDTMLGEGFSVERTRNKEAGRETGGDTRATIGPGNRCSGK